MCTKILESIAISINDIMADRVKKFARYQRSIKDNELKEYNSIDAIAYSLYKLLDSEFVNSNFEDLQLAMPGKMNGKQIIMLFTTDRIIIVEHNDYRFIPRYQIHFSECRIFNEDQHNVVNHNQLPNVQLVGKKLGFLKNLDGERFLYLHFDAVKKNWFGCLSKNTVELRIQLFKFEENSVISEQYNAMIENIFKKYSDNDAK